MKKVVLITGATSGIGKATAELLSNKGYIVYGTGRNVQTQPQGYTLLPMDIRQSDSVEKVVKTILEKEKRIDILINNAGVGISGAMEEIPQTEFENIFQTNFFGVIELLKKVLIPMREHKSGFILNITSIAGYMGLPFRSGYSASKGALQLLSESLRMEVKPLGIKVTTLAPGDVATSIASRRFHTPIISSSPYAQNYQLSLKLMNQDVDKGQNPQIIAQKIYKIIRTKSPKVHYKQASLLQRISVLLKNILPDTWFEKLLMNHYKLN